MTLFRAILIWFGFAAGLLPFSARGAGAEFELPTPAMTPEESLAAITVRSGMRVELVAAEPLVMDPIDLAWGPDGRVWVVEMADYPMGMDGKGRPGGRVRFLEDVDGDGCYDTSTLFADGLNFPTGVMPWRDGVLVTAAPEILLLKDTDGDGRADQREVLYRGFVEGNQQHRVNGLRWGLDNWISIANGDSGGKIESFERGVSVDISGRDLRIRPDEGAIDALSGRTQYGRNRDDWGNWFGCSNSRPMWHFVQEDRYLRRNPHLAAAGATRELQERAARVFPVSETVARFNQPESANRFTSACGAMVYRDTLLGDDFHGNAFVAEPVHNLVHREVLRPAGVTFSSARAEDELESEFFASADPWSRPVAVKTGPDGALWIVDMYRAVIEHPQWIPDDWEAALDLRAGEDKGRIYRVYPKGVQPRAVGRLDRLPVDGLVAALESPNGEQRDRAHQLLLWNDDPAARGFLANLARRSEQPLGRLHALCVLDGLGALDAALLAEALGDAHPGVRRHAVRLCEGRVAEPEGAVVAALSKLADDRDPFVRMQMAYSLGEWKEAWAGRALGKIAVASVFDDDVRTAILSSALPHMDGLVEAALREGAPGAHRALARDLIVLAAAMGEKEMVARLLVSFVNEPEAPDARFASIAVMLDTLSRRKMSLRSLSVDAGADLKPVLALVNGVVVDARKMIADGAGPLESRVAAVGLLGRGVDRQEEDVERLKGLLGPGVASALKIAAVQSLGGLGRKDTPALLLKGWAGHSPAVRAAVLDTILSRGGWIPELLDEAKGRPELLATLDASRRQALIQNPSKEVRERAQVIFGEAAVSNREAIVEKYRGALALEGDVGRGKALFAAACASCHRLGDTGREIGPDLNALTDKSQEALLVAIVDPNRAVEDKFMQYVAITKDGLTLAGLVVEESGNGVTLLGVDGEPRTVLVADLKSFTSTGKSMMPEGLEAAFDVQAMADVMAFVARGGE